MHVFEAKARAKSFQKVFNVLKEVLDDACIYSDGQSLIIRNLTEDPQAKCRSVVLELASSWFEKFQAATSITTTISDYPHRPFCINIPLISKILNFEDDDAECTLVDDGGHLIIKFNSKGTSWYKLDRRQAWRLWLDYLPTPPRITPASKCTTKMSSAQFNQVVEHLYGFNDQICITMGYDGVCFKQDSKSKSAPGLYDTLVNYPAKTLSISTTRDRAQVSSFQDLAGDDKKKLVVDDNVEIEIEMQEGAPPVVSRGSLPLPNLVAISRFKVLSPEVQLSISARPGFWHDSPDMLLFYQFRHGSIKYYLKPRPKPLTVVQIVTSGIVLFFALVIVAGLLGHLVPPV